jgi:succinyl-diaminopimelate desuccinylase
LLTASSILFALHGKYYSNLIAVIGLNSKEYNMVLSDEGHCLIDILDKWCEANRDEFIADIKALVRIPSVSRERSGPYPFGEDCGRVVDEAARIIGRLGLKAQPCDYYGISALYPGEGRERIGLFSHLDVVPAGDGWDTPPFEPVERDAYLIGRGGPRQQGTGCGLSLYAEIF